MTRTVINSIGYFLFAAIFLSSSSAAFSQTKSVPPVPQVLADSRQMLLVTTKDWDCVQGVLRRFVKRNSDEAWTEVAAPFPVVVGRNGLGWGKGLHPENKSAPQKKEGDGKSPAGIFKLSSAFGFAPANQVNLKLPYLQITEEIECVDDVKSARYNSFVDHSHIINPDWSSSEKMLAIGEQYRLGIVVDHNVTPRVSGAGSCIFLHIWKGDGSGTSGCTAMGKNEMEELTRWLDPAENPVLVQLLEAEFRRVQQEWHLPSLNGNSAAPQ